MIVGDYNPENPSLCGFYDSFLASNWKFESNLSPEPLV